jgi:hypothetical protein
MKDSVGRVELWIMKPPPSQHRTVTCVPQDPGCSSTARAEIREITQVHSLWATVALSVAWGRWWVFNQLCSVIVRISSKSRIKSTEIKRGFREFVFLLITQDRLCGLVVRVLGYRFGCHGSIPGTTRKKEKEKSSVSGTRSTQPREDLLDRKLAAPVYKTENTAVGIRHANHVAPSIRKTLEIT